MQIYFCRPLCTTTNIPAVSVQLFPRIHLCIKAAISLMTTVHQGHPESKQWPKIARISYKAAHI